MESIVEFKYSKTVKSEIPLAYSVDVKSEIPQKKVTYRTVF